MTQRHEERHLFRGDLKVTPMELLSRVRRYLPILYLLLLSATVAGQAYLYSHVKDEIFKLASLTAYVHGYTLVQE